MYRRRAFLPSRWRPSGTQAAKRCCRKRLSEIDSARQAPGACNWACVISSTNGSIYRLAKKGRRKLPLFFCTKFRRDVLLLKIFPYFCATQGGLAQLARALAWHARGHRFDSDILHLILKHLLGKTGKCFFYVHTICTPVHQFGTSILAISSK